jgi:tRNA pseudouridine55 synthase
VALDGILLVNKDAGRTSFETVQLVRKKIHARKAGHTGTLDKSASGLLLVCINRATAIQGLLTNHFKRYRGTVRFGIETDTLDNDGVLVRSGSVGPFPTTKVKLALEAFKGRIQQIPPVYSALHKNGKRMHTLARSGRVVSPEPRDVEIKSLTLLKNDGGSIRIDVTASRGTYVRSLARDIANTLGTCGYLSALHRLYIGSFSVEKAITVDEVDESTPVVPMMEALRDYAQIEIGENLAIRVRNGVPADKILQAVGEQLPQGGYLCLVHRKQLVAVVELHDKPGYFKVFS